jgi:hypothetical protein
MKPPSLQLSSPYFRSPLSDWRANDQSDAKGAGLGRIRPWVAYEGLSCMVTLTLSGYAVVDGYSHLSYLPEFQAAVNAEEF